MSKIQSFSKKQWTEAERIKGVMVRVTIRHHDGDALEVEGVFDTGSAQHDIACAAQRSLLRQPPVDVV